MPSGKIDFDVAIVGYGPGGQLLAGLLAHRGWRVVVVERYPSLFNLPRAGHVDHECLRMVQSVTDPTAYLNTLWEVRDDYVWLNGAGDVIMHQPEHDTGDAVSGYYSDFSHWQPEMETALDKGAVEAGADIRLGWECTALSQDGDKVTLNIAESVVVDGELRSTGKTQTLTARYAVGMDGANSFVRRALGIERDDSGFDEHWLVSDMEIIEPVAFSPNIGQICDPARPRMLMPLGHKHRRFEWMVLPGESVEEFRDESRAWSLLAEFGVTPDNHRIARNVVYRFQARMATRWRTRRVLIGGDAAHTMPPYAGQGMLSSLRDANNLGWKLDLVLRDMAPDALLDTYETERRNHVAAWTQISIAEGRISCELDPERAAARDAALMSGTAPMPPTPPKIEEGVVPGRTSPYAHPISGQLGLQARVTGPNGDEGLLDDVVGSSRLVLLTRGGAASNHLGPAQLARLNEMDAVVAEILVEGSAPRAGALVDVTGKYSAWLDELGIDAVLIRPDFIAFGAVRDLRDLPGLIDTFLERLEGKASPQPIMRTLTDTLRYPEAPRWHDGRLWVSDVHDYALKTIDLDGNVEVIARFPNRPSGMGILPDGSILMATALDCKLHIVKNGNVTEVADLSGLAKGTLNDMVVAADGRCYVGDTGFKMGQEKPRPGTIISWKAGSAPHIAAEDVFFSNGAVITPDGRRLFVAETFARCISRFDIAADGSLSAREVFAKLDMPADGICLDAEGGIWVGLPEAGRFVRLDSNGRLDRAIAGAAPFCIVPMLGGPERKTLFLCSADTSLPRLSKGDTTGRIDVVETDIPGAGRP